MPFFLLFCVEYIMILKRRLTEYTTRRSKIQLRLRTIKSRLFSSIYSVLLQTTSSIWWGTWLLTALSFTFHGHHTRCYCLSLFECNASQNRTQRGWPGQVALIFRLMKCGQIYHMDITIKIWSARSTVLWRKEDAGQL